MRKILQKGVELYGIHGVVNIYLQNGVLTNSKQISNEISCVSTRHTVSMHKWLSYMYTCESSCIMISQTFRKTRHPSWATIPLVSPITYQSYKHLLSVRTGPKWDRCWQHRSHFGPILTHYGLFTGQIPSPPELDRPKTSFKTSDVPSCWFAI